MHLIICCPNPFAVSSAYIFELAKMLQLYNLDPNTRGHPCELVYIYVCVLPFNDKKEEKGNICQFWRKLLN